MKLSIIGLGKLGAPLAAVMAHKGHRVTGVDVSPDCVSAIERGRAPVSETGLAEMIRRNRKRLSATMDYQEAIAASNITFIIVPTPSQPDGAFSLDYVIAAAGKIGAALREKDSWHLVVLSSTVMPGATEGSILPVLEASSGKKCGRDFGLCYNPEFIALGSVIRDMLNPDMILIGESDPRSVDLLEKLYTSVCDNQPRVHRMSFVNAELAKLSVNIFITAKISYANMLAQVAETLPGADVDVVTAAVGSDTRIGPKYLKGALGYGGPCFPRDNHAFAALARANGAPALLAEASDQLNGRQAPRLAELILRRLPANGTVGILGLSYKPNTGVIEESQGIALAEYLLAAGVRLAVYDPEAMEAAKARLPHSVTFVATAAQCAGLADVLAITTPWAEFRELSPQDLNRERRPTIVDCWRVLRPRKFRAVADYMTLGLGPEKDQSEPASASAHAMHSGATLATQP
jgi:UDPglucose 6-dehydrogenase